MCTKTTRASCAKQECCVQNININDYMYIIKVKRVNIVTLQTISRSAVSMNVHVKVYQVGQSRFTVYCHKVFNFYVHARDRRAMPSN